MNTRKEEEYLMRSREEIACSEYGIKIINDSL